MLSLKRNLFLKMKIGEMMNDINIVKIESIKSYFGIK